MEVGVDLAGDEVASQDWFKILKNIFRVSTFQSSVTLVF